MAFRTGANNNPSRQRRRARRAAAQQEAALQEHAAQATLHEQAAEAALHEQVEPQEQAEEALQCVLTAVGPATSYSCFGSTLIFFDFFF